MWLHTGSCVGSRQGRRLAAHEVPYSEHGALRRRISACCPQITMSSSDCLPFSLGTLDCRNSTGWCLRPYGDVSGYGVRSPRSPGFSFMLACSLTLSPHTIQVIIGSKGTGYYVVFLLIAYYVTAFDPRRNPFEPDGAEPTTTMSSWKPNPIDIMVLDFIRMKCASRRMSKHCRRFGECLVIVRDTSGSLPLTTFQAPGVSDAYH